jgi:RNA polymerase sigma-70 factor, ECF subfamily
LASRFGAIFREAYDSAIESAPLPHEAGVMSALDPSPTGNTRVRAADMARPDPIDGSPDSEAMDAASRAFSAQRLRVMLDDHFDLVWRMLRRLGVPESRAEDVAQDVFIVASEKIESILLGREKAYLIGVAVRLAKDVRQLSAVRHERALPESDALRDGGADPEALLVSVQERAILDEILAEFDDDERAVFVLYEIEQYSSPEIAEVLNLPLGTVASRLKRARETFERKVSIFQKKMQKMEGRAG